VKTAVPLPVILWACARALGAEPIDIGSRRELLVDDYLDVRLAPLQQVLAHIGGITNDQDFTGWKPAG
jgi:hypothetical protein